MKTSTPAWDDLRVLLELHRQGSFLAAGRALGVSTSTASRRIEALEASLDRRLVQRTSAGTAVEPDALELVALAEQLEHGLRAARRDDAGGGAALAGTVRISAGEGFIRPLTHLVSDVRRKHPEIHFELIAEARLSDLARRQADIGIRKARSSSPVLVEKPAGRLRFALYASRGYVERRLRGGRLRAEDFGRHDFVRYDAGAPHVQERWLEEHGVRRVPFRSSSDLALLEAAARGQGIGLFPEALGRTVEELVRLDVQATLPTIPIFVVFHRELRAVPRIRVVVRALTEALRHGLA